MLLPVDVEIENDVRQKCSEFLGGPWMTTAPEDIQVDRLKGFANSNFSATLTSLDISKYPSVPKKVAVHLYGDNIFGKEALIKYNGEAAEAVIMDTLSRSDLAPKVLGVFPNGRIEEFVPSRNLVLEDFEDTSLSVEMGQILARIHASEMPIRKAADRLQVMHDQIQDIPCKGLSFDKITEEDQANHKKYKEFPLQKEVNFVSNLLSKLGPKPVFCHNDFHLDNQLLRETPAKSGQRLLPVDLELSSYFYRGYDFAYHYTFRKLKPERVSETKIEMVHLEDKNEERDKKLAIESYLSERRKLTNNNLGPEDTLEHILMEIECAQLAVSLVFYCYTRLSPQPIDDPSAFEKYCLMLQDYYAKKGEVSKKYGHLLDEKVNNNEQ